MFQELPSRTTDRIDQQDRPTSGRNSEQRWLCTAQSADRRGGEAAGEQAGIRSRGGRVGRRRSLAPPPLTGGGGAPSLPSLLLRAPARPPLRASTPHHRSIIIDLRCGEAARNRYIFDVFCWRPTPPPHHQAENCDSQPRCTAARRVPAALLARRPPRQRLAHHGAARAAQRRPTDGRALRQL